MRYLPFTHPSHFLKERDFGQKIEASFDFVRAHFKPLGKALLMIVLPVSLVLGLLSGIIMLTWFNSLLQFQQSTQNGQFSASMMGSLYSRLFLSPEYLGLLLGGLVLLTTLTLTVYGYVTLRLDTAPATEVTVGDVWRLVRQRFLDTLLAFVGLVVLFFLASLIVTMVMGLAGYFLLLGNGRDRLMMGFFGVLIAFGIFAVLTYVSVALSLFLIVWVRERRGFFPSIGRSFKLVWGKWWSTFGLIVVMSIIRGIILLAVTLLSSLISSPFVLAGGTKLEGAARIGFVLATALRSMLSLAIYPLILLALAFQYFNLVERKEGEGLHLLVDTIGQPAPEAVPHARQPDDEGEY